MPFAHGSFSEIKIEVTNRTSRSAVSQPNGNIVVNNFFILLTLWYNIVYKVRAKLIAYRLKYQLSSC